MQSQSYGGAEGNFQKEAWMNYRTASGIGGDQTAGYSYAISCSDESCDMSEVL